MMFYIIIELNQINIIDNFNNNNKSYIFFESLRDLKTFYNILLTTNITQNEIYCKNSDIKNDTHKIQTSRIILSTASIFNCITIDSTDNDKIYIITNNLLSVKPYNCINNALRLRKSKVLNIYIKDTKMLYIKNKIYNDKDIKLLKMHNQKFYNYLKEFELSFIDCIKILINKDADFKVNFNIDKINKFVRIKDTMIYHDIKIKSEKLQILTAIFNDYNITNDTSIYIEKMYNNYKNFDDYFFDNNINTNIDDIKYWSENINYQYNNVKITDQMKDDFVKFYEKRNLAIELNTIIDKYYNNLYKSELKPYIINTREFVRNNKLNKNNIKYDIKEQTLLDIKTHIKNKDYSKLNTILNDPKIKLHIKYYETIEKDEIFHIDIKRPILTNNKNIILLNDVKNISNRNTKKILKNLNENEMIINYNIITDSHRHKYLERKQISFKLYNEEFKIF